MLNKKTKSQIIESVERAETWERIPTSIQGINLVKTPEYKNKEMVLVAIDISPKKSLFLKNSSELKSLLEQLTKDEVHELIDFVGKHYNNSSNNKIEIKIGDD